MSRAGGWVYPLVTVAVLGLAGAGVIALMREGETTAAMRGRAIAAAQGCFACHGPEGAGGVLDRSAP